MLLYQQMPMSHLPGAPSSSQLWEAEALTIPFFSGKAPGPLYRRYPNPVRFVSDCGLSARNKWA